MYVFVVLVEKVNAVGARDDDYQCGKHYSHHGDKFPEQHHEPQRPEYAAAHNTHGKNDSATGTEIDEKYDDDEKDNGKCETYGVPANVVLDPAFDNGSSRKVEHLRSLIGFDDLCQFVAEVLRVDVAFNLHVNGEGFTVFRDNDVFQNGLCEHLFLEFCDLLTRLGNLPSRKAGFND